MRRTSRGFTILEVMIALAVLLVGLLGLLRLHVLGMTSNTGGRMYTEGVEIARELVSGIERLQYTDPLLSENCTGATATSPCGSLITSSGAVVSTGVHTWADTSPLPGVRPDAALPRPGTFQRRWTVWGYQPAGASVPAARIVAVSVIWSEPTLPRPREVVLYTQLPNPAALMLSLQVNQ